MYANKYGIEKDISINCDLTESYESAEPNYHVPQYSQQDHDWWMLRELFSTHLLVRSIDQSIAKEQTNDMMRTNTLRFVINQSKRSNVKIELILGLYRFLRKNFTLIRIYLGCRGPSAYETIDNSLLNNNYSVAIIC